MKSYKLYPTIFSFFRSYFEIEPRSGRVLARKGFDAVSDDLLPFRLQISAR